MEELWETKEKWDHCKETWWWNTEGKVFYEIAKRSFEEYQIYKQDKNHSNKAIDEAKRRVWSEC